MPSATTSEHEPHAILGNPFLAALLLAVWVTLYALLDRFLAERSIGAPALASRDRMKP